MLWTTPQEVALLDARKSIQFAKKLNLPFIGMVENMSGFTCPYCNKKIDLFGTGRAKKTEKELNIMFLGDIPMEPEVIRLCDRGEILKAIKGKSSVSESIMKISEHIIKYAESKEYI